MFDPCHGCDGSECMSCWRDYKADRLTRSRTRKLEVYAPRMRAGETPFFRARTGRGQWGTGIQRREHSVQGWQTRRGKA